MTLLTTHEREAFEQRKRRAIAQLSAYIDVLSACRGTYEDDSEPAGIGWITEVIPQISNDPMGGHLCIDGTARPGIGWRINDAGAFEIGTVLHGLRGKPWPVTRGEFRAEARKCGVSLPSTHATYKDQ